MADSQNTDPDRRRFTRIAFDARTQLRAGDRVWPVQLLDISLKGVLVKEIDPVDLGAADDLEVNVTLIEHEITIVLPVKLVRSDSPYLGFVCGTIDLESITHLRRLVELNLGDQSLLDRELEHLSEGR